ncbi:MAG: ArsR/SmtB family transcription factor [Devosia sp.]|jgi:DNA-binding transcriptional ArsR family regulator
MPDLAILMRTLADPTRRALYERVVDAGEAAVVELTAGSGVSQPAVSQHLKALRTAGLVAERREGRNTRYRATPEGLAPLVDWIGVYGVFWADRFASLKSVLKEIDPE